MRLELHPEALLEYEGAVTYYEDRQPGLGGRFIVSVEATFGSIRENPETGLFLAQDVQRRLTRVFPYAVLYTVEPEYILVIAVMHCHQEPGYWRLRVGG
ncbi:MAG: type II toxin-antitoxin system RelE/ParE family toxin [Steroidobacteraceae bacterium]